MMNQTAQHPRAAREARTYGLLLAALSLSLAALTGCSDNPSQPQEEEMVSASFSIQPEDLFTASHPSEGHVSALSVHALAFSLSDVQAIKIDVKEKTSGTVLLVNFDLTKAIAPATGWTGTIPALPKGKALTFSARAFNSAAPSPPPTLLFKGSTDQSLTGNNQSVSIALSPANDGQTILLPRVVRISLPSAFSSSQANNISFAVEASTGENLKYALTAADSGGAFYPSNGALTLAATAGTFVTQYLPPTVTSDTLFEHKVTVTNAAGHSVTTTFKTLVKPPGKGDNVQGSGVTVLFNPVINALNGSRVSATSDVVFTATVADDSPADQLVYTWSFVADGTFDPAPSFTGTTQSGTLHNYTSAVQGKVVVSVKDPQGGTTTLNYSFLPNQFPDNPAVEGDSNGLNTIRAGNNHTCALFNNGDLRCWGRGTFGQLGYGNTFDAGDAPDKVPSKGINVPFVGKAAKLAVGSNHTCVLLDSGYVACWGENQYGQLGYNTTDDVGDSEAVSSFGYVNLGGTAIKIAAGGNHTCALMDTGKVRCWGYNNFGQLGYGHKLNVGDGELPWTIGDVQVGAPVIDIVAGGNHTCALLNNSSVRCWGYNNFGQLGTGNTLNVGDTQPASSAPVVNLSGGVVIQLTAGANHTCALLDTGYSRCWGLGSSGQLGNGGTGNTTTPTVDLITGGKVLQIAAGSNHTCALLESGNLKCWGANAKGELGLANITPLTSPSTTPVNMNGATVMQVNTGANHTCVLLSTGKARCWGLNDFGQLGYGHKDNIGDGEQPYLSGDISIVP